MRILITGGSGFIGRNLAEEFAHFITSKAGAPGTPASQPSPRYEVLAPPSAELDLLNEQAVRDYLGAHHFDAIVHAATTRSNRRIAAPVDMLDRNCRMFFNLVRNEGLFGKMIHFGSGAEYGPRALLPSRVREDYFDTHVPTDAYGFSKYICAKCVEGRDESAKGRGKAGGQKLQRRGDIVELRLFAVFGPHEDYSVRFISNACCRALKGLPIILRQDLFFDYLYVKDLARITSWFVENSPRHAAYNICSGNPIRLTELARIVAEVSGRNPVISVAATLMGHEYGGDNSRMLAELGTGFQFYDMRAAISELYAWYGENSDRIDPASLRFDES
jgi:UDP-glucose 4-epimerase